MCVRVFGCVFVRVRVICMCTDNRAKHDVTDEEGGGVGVRGGEGRGKCDMAGAPTNTSTASSSGSANKQAAPDLPPINLTSTKVMRVLLSSWAVGPRTRMYGLFVYACLCVVC